MKRFIDSINLLTQSNSIQCNICSLTIPNSCMILHTTDHFSHLGLSADICGYCNKSIFTDSVESVLEHVISNHQLKIGCPICTSHYKSMDDLYYHLQGKMKIVYHCSNSGCLWMTDENVELAKHIKQMKHKENSSFIETIFSCKYDRHQNSASVHKPRFQSLIQKCPISSDTACKSSDVNDNVLPSTNARIVEKENKVTHSGDLNPELKSFENIKFSNSKSFYNFTYSHEVLCKFLGISKQRMVEDFIFKLKKLNEFHWSILSTKHSKKFICQSCNFTSLDNFDDLKMHILFSHCKISVKNLSFIMKFIFCNFENSRIMESKLIESINNDIKLNKLKATKLLSDCNSVNKFGNDSSSCEIEWINKKNWKFINRINLHYSKKFLKFICAKENCLNKFNLLRQKMDKFTTLEMKVFRSNDRNIYVCSSCKEYSRQGLRNIIIHILKFHAKMENESEKLQKIAAACCRMDKNYRLLTYEKLEEKWYNDKE